MTTRTPAAPPRLQPLSADWLPAVATLDAQAQAHPWTLRQFSDALAAGYHAEVLVQADGTLLGFFIAMQALDEGHLLCISVAPAHQGQGHGQRLLHALQDWAQRQGITALWLEVRASNARAQALYTRHGFEAVGQRKNYYPCGAGAREAAIVMCQTL